MPEIVAWLQANLSLAVIAAAAIAFAVPRVRDWLLTRVLGYAWWRITERAREEHALAQRKHARRERLREALGVLTEGLSSPSTRGADSRVKVQQAITELRAEGPSDLAEHLDKITPLVEGKSRLTESEIRALVDPLITGLRDDPGQIN